MILFALRMLLGARVKFFGIVAGVLFTSFLCTHFQAIVCGLMTRTFAMIGDTNVADVWVMDPAVEYIDEVANLPGPAIDRVRSVPGVEWAARLYYGSLRARLPGGRFRSVQVIGVEDATLIGLPGRITSGHAEDLRRPDAVIIDTYSCRNLMRAAIDPPAVQRGAIDLDAPSRPLDVGDELTINDHRVVIVGKADILPRFLTKGTFFTTYTRAVRMAPPERNQLSFVLVRGTPGQSADELAARIEATTGLKALSARAFAAATVWYFVKNTDVIGQVILMTLIAILVGTCITGLLLYMFTAENLRFYGMLMAVGATGGTILRMVIAQTLTAATLGYCLGVGASAALGQVMELAHLPYRLLWPSFLITAFFVLLVGVVASIFSVRQTLRLEPGVVFRAT